MFLLKNITENGCYADTKTAVALGIFDGVHMGHRAVFDKIKTYKNKGLAPAVFTFQTESITQKHEKNYRFIIPNNDKLKFLDNYGIQYAYCSEFEKIKFLSGEEFVSQILIRKLKAAVVACGPEFRFGKDASCGVSDLYIMGEKHGFDVNIVDPVKIDNIVVSSTTIKTLISEGNIKEANAFLGYKFGINQPVVHGNEIGRQLNFPTINQNFLPDQIVPRFGVYASQSVIDGHIYSSVTNVGVKPTVCDISVPLAETHILGYNGNLYGKQIEVTFSDFIRDERRFGSLDELRHQIDTDIKAAIASGGK